ncbi:MAG: hypothetical protein NTV01_01950 [Bacteroidia bacterium]|nr:hypothetical protein [Bacteroidia bacterium]
MRHKNIIILVVLLMVSGMTAGWCQTKKFYFPTVDWKTGWAAGFKVGTLGPGIEGVKSVNSNWNARLGFSFMPFPINRHIVISNLGLDVSAKNRIGGVNLQGDFFFRPWFYFTGGLLVNLIHSNVNINLTDTVQYGDISINPGLMGTLTAKVRPGWVVAPFLGIGFGNAIPLNRNVWFNVELGVIYNGKPHISLDGQGMINPTASAENEKALGTAFKGYRFYPLFSAQVNYRIR